MAALSMENPVFVSYMVAASIMILKLMGQGWMTVFRMLKSDAGMLNPEDLLPGPANRNPRPEQLLANDYVERSRRMQRNDLENIPAFLAAGLIFVAAQPSLWLANSLMIAFVVARLFHAVAYATGQRHEVRATFFSIGSIVVIVMALYALAAALA
ncbi:MAG: MAPEG family protein [Alphaproteobacteria bacterium]|jgi:glutathione S-transferase|nr:MAPEG family protein [Alphaproteobacteria bacterium]MBU0804025.1 MAPEG family protein [Alphaproteobacteria bacterium]MBU0872678.1 MAPEG family protein [Alphaproteobacteria bacterium]MBU1402952.1 MAPEG family protein [Alphaproteobacteria bacterium]MBU1593594.1 MAPEG family protein [Alphaproteobacteria bacterium]